MATLAPNGFTPIYSYSNSALAQSGLVEFPYGATYFNGFAGDVLCQNFFAGTVGNTSNPQAPLGFCYPYPVNFQGNNGTATGINWCPILGVAVGFRYQPLSQNGLWVDSTNWVVGTPIMPNSTVWVTVQTDIQNIFKVQTTAMYPSTTPTSISQDYLFYNTGITAQAVYSVTLPEVTTGTVNPVNALTFGLGDITPNGRSTQSIVVTNSAPGSFTPIEVYPFTIMGVTNGSKFTNSALQISETNQWVACRINWAWSQMSLLST